MWQNDTDCLSCSSSSSFMKIFRQSGQVQEDTVSLPKILASFVSYKGGGGWGRIDIVIVTSYV